MFDSFSEGWYAKFFIINPTKKNDIIYHFVKGRDIILLTLDIYVLLIQVIKVLSALINDQMIIDHLVRLMMKKS